MWFHFFSRLTWLIPLIGWILNQLCITGVNSTWLWYNFLILYWHHCRFTSICTKIIRKDAHTLCAISTDNVLQKLYYNIKTRVLTLVQSTYLILMSPIVVTHICVCMCVFVCIFHHVSCVSTSQLRYRIVSSQQGSPFYNYIQFLPTFHHALTPGNHESVLHYWNLVFSKCMQME